MTEAMYRLGNLLIGNPITPPPIPNPPLCDSSTEWTVQAGVYSPRQLVHSFSPLLLTVLHHLGPDPPSSPPSRTLLLDNIAANLATDTREASLPLPAELQDPSRREIRSQAHRIATHLVKWAYESTDTDHHHHHHHHHHSPPPAFNAALNIRSPCEGHLLLPLNVALLFGPRSKPHLMQLFNEYMHQMVLLRDSLLPFQNYEDVLIPIPANHSPGPQTRGIRSIEAPREQFLTVLLTKHVTQASVVRLARALLAPELPRPETEGYAFQYAHGLVLPALFAPGGPSPPQPPPLHLLQYLPAKIHQGASEVWFRYEYPDYYLAPRVEIPPGALQKDAAGASPTVPAPRVTQASLSLRDPKPTLSDSIAQLDLRLIFDNGAAADVDVGQIARGFRYAYQAAEPGEEEDVPEYVAHSAYEVLTGAEAGLVTAEKGGLHVIPAEERRVSLAVLGKLYPENVVGLGRDQGLERTVRAGKGFEPKFVVWGVDSACRGG